MGLSRVRRELDTWWRFALVSNDGSFAGPCILARKRVHLLFTSILPSEGAHVLMDLDVIGGKADCGGRVSQSVHRWICQLYPPLPSVRIAILKYRCKNLE